MCSFPLAEPLLLACPLSILNGSLLGQGGPLSLFMQHRAQPFSCYCNANHHYYLAAQCSSKFMGARRPKVLSCFEKISPKIWQVSPTPRLVKVFVFQSMDKGKCGFRKRLRRKRQHGFKFECGDLAAECQSEYNPISFIKVTPHSVN